MSYNSKVVKKVLNDFDNKYKAAAANAEKRKNELYAKIPGLWDTDKKIADTYKEIAWIMLNSGEEFKSKIGGVKEKNAALREKRKSLIESAGYNESYMDSVYECADCEDTGYKGEIMCGCLRKALAAESIEHSGLGRITKNQTFENFDLNYYEKKKSSAKLEKENPYVHMKGVYEACKSFAENFGGENSGNLIFMGGTGLGKTHLSSAIAREVIKKGCDVYYDSAQSILYSFEKERFSRHGTFDADIIERYMTCDLLIIDDLGTEYPGNMAVSSLYNLINMRLIDRKSMIISTNLSGSEIEMKYDDRIVSRMFGEFEPLNFTGDDIRLKKVGE